MLPPLAQLLGTVGGHESEDHGKIVVEVAWVCAFLTGGKGECVPPVVDAGLLAALAAHVHRQSAALTAAPNTPELEEANRERSARVIPFVRALGNIAAMEEDRYAGAVMSALEEGGAAAVVPSLLAMLAHGPRPLHRLLQVRKHFTLFAKLWCRKTNDKRGCRWILRGCWGTWARARRRTWTRWWGRGRWDRWWRRWSTARST